MNTLKKIRERNSYHRFELAYQRIKPHIKNTYQDAHGVLFTIWYSIDNLGGYKYRKTGMYAKESMLQLLRDLKDAGEFK